MADKSSQAASKSTSRQTTSSHYSLLLVEAEARAAEAKARESMLEHTMQAKLNLLVAKEESVVAEARLKALETYEDDYDENTSRLSLPVPEMSCKAKVVEFVSDSPHTDLATTEPIDTSDMKPVIRGFQTYHHIP